MVNNELNFKPAEYDVELGINPDKIDQFKQSVIRAVMADFIYSHKSDIELYKTMVHICPDDAYFLLNKLKANYKSCDITDTFKGILKIKPIFNCSEVQCLQLTLVYKDVDVAIDTVKDKDCNTQVFGVFDSASNAEILKICQQVVKYTNDKLTQNKKQNELKQAIDEVRPESLKNKIFNLMTNLKE